MKCIFKKSLLLSLYLVPFFAKAQNEVEMADTMQKDGKIYVVVTVLSIILLGILIFLISIDLKLKKIEEKDQK